MHDAGTIKCLIVDDEPPARQVLRHYVQQAPCLELAGECSNALQALDFLQRNQVDLMFLDINMPQLKGTELLKVLSNAPKTIFITAHADYAIESYELDAVDYLLKPVQFDRFLKAVNKLFRQHNVHLVASDAPVERKNAAEPYIYLRSDRKMVKVLLNDIFYIESMKDYVKVFTASGVIITRQSIVAMNAMLPDDTFIRIHRSFIVNTAKITSYTGEIISVQHTEIPIGKLFRQTVMKQLE